MSKQSRPANPSDLLTHPDVVHAIRRQAKDLMTMRLFRRVPREDIRADLQLEVAIRLQLFDPARSCLNTYATMAARSGAASMIRSRAARARCGDKDTISIEVALAECADPAVFMSEAFARATGREHVDVTRFPETKEALDAVMRTLPPHLSEVAVALLQCTRRGTCIRLGMSRRQLDQLTDQIRRICNSIDLHP